MDVVVDRVHRRLRVSEESLNGLCALVSVGFALSLSFSCCFTSVPKLRLELTRALVKSYGRPPKFFLGASALRKGKDLRRGMALLGSQA